MSAPVWRDGRIDDGVEAPDRRAASRGAFTTAGCDHGRPLLWNRHQRRLAGSLELLGAPPPALPSEAEMAALLEACGRSGPARLRLVGWQDDRRWRLEAAVGDARSVGPDASAVALEIVCWPAAPPLAGHKTLDRLAWELAADGARAAGADDALLVDAAGRVLETSVANLWVVRGGRLLTPPAPARCLPGVLRGWLLEHAHRAGLTAAEADLELAELEHADEVWITNAVVGVRRVARVGDRTWTAWPVFARLARLHLPAPGWPGR